MACFQWEYNANQLVKPAVKRASFLGSWRNRGSSKILWPEAASDDELLRTWIRENGGYVHPGLQLAPSTTKWNRKVWVAKEEIGFETVSTQPLIVIPTTFRLSTADALETVQEVLKDSGCKKKLKDCHLYGLYLASSDACLAICLAYERNRGRRSPFYPYISSLTNETPGFFSKDVVKVKQLLRQMGVQSRDTQKFLDVVNRERESLLVFAKFAVKILSLGKLLGVTVNDVMWCLSHVFIRRFTDKGEAFGHIRPSLDCVAAHEASGSPFDLGKIPGHGRVYPCGSLHMLVSLLDGVPRPLSIGDELYTSFSGPFGGNFEEQIINNVELYGTPSIATAEALVLRLRERSDKPNGALTPWPGYEGPGLNPQKWQPSHAQQSLLAAKIARLLKEEPHQPICQIWKDRRIWKPWNAEGQLQQNQNPLFCKVQTQPQQDNKFELTSYPATMSYGDYNPDEVSDKFQDGLNLEGQGQGGGYGGGDGGDYEGERPKHHKKRGEEGDGGYGGDQPAYGGGDGGYGGGDDGEGQGGYGGGNDKKTYGGDDSGGYGAQAPTYGGDDSEDYGSKKKTGYGGDDGEGYGAQKTSYGDDGEGYGAKKTGYGDDDTEGYGAKKTGYGGDDGEGYGAQKTSYGDDGEGYGAKNPGYGDDNVPQYDGVSGGLSGGAYPTRGEAGPTDVSEEVTEVAAGGTLNAGQTLKSPNGQSKLVLQADGNLVLYKGGNAVWSSGTDRSNEKPAVLAVQDDGNVCLYAAGGAFCGWATNTGGSDNVKLVVSDSGVLVVLSGEKGLWSSAPISPSDAAEIALAATSSY
ncbi:hypothetical protein WJX75_009330 [Coccomyxa subellipsoidea]|uniref:Bulb-type lectin domain-containing protein n=1 Tax=Coccomyxa subellipsoidea TaxID=248742 RepID=A0ABR2Z572_9CHLO